MKKLKFWIMVAVLSVPGPAFPQSAEVQDKIYTLAINDWRNMAEQTRMARDQSSPEWAKPIFARWEEEEKKPDQGKLFELLTTPKDGQELSAALGWLRVRILLGRADARYSFAYAFNLFRSRHDKGDYKLEGVQFFLHGKHALRVDAARCADNSAPVRKIVGYESQLHDIANFEKEGMQPKARFIARIMAIALEDFVGARERQEWLCSGGTGAIAQHMKENEGELGLKEVPLQPGDIGRTFVFDSKKLKVEFIEDEFWWKKRQEYLEVQRAQVFTNLP